jgi:hypothetical protein
MIACALALAAALPQHGERPQARVPELADPAIALDGLLDEAAWREAAVLDDFHTVEPVPGLDVDPPWEIRILRSATHLYFGMTFWEPEPERMVLLNERRDALLEADDRIEFILDTFADGTTAYFFQVSAGGSRGDALVGDNGRRFNKPWNGFWDAGVARLPDRWVAEIAIPFATLAFGDGDVWRANFERTRGADRSTSRWAAARREFRLFNVREGGELTGFAGARHGVGLEFRPYLKATGRDGAEPAADDGFEFDGGGELSWRITPQLAAALTWNTDFAETEVDERQINLGRFPLFFPEKRDFFLQDSTLFQFGEQGGSNMLPYFSRRIGRVDDAEVPLEVGARLAGRAGRWDLGLLGVHTGDAPELGVEDADLFVLRPSFRVNGDLAVGGLLTHGDPALTTSNTVAGADLRWNSTSWLPGNTNVNAFMVASDDEASGETGVGFGFEGGFRSEDWSGSLRSLGSSEDFRPALGFVSRPGDWLNSASATWQPRPGGDFVRNYEFGISPYVWTDVDGDLIGGGVSLTPFAVEWESGDEFELELTSEHDRPPEDFEIADGIVVDAGSYRWEQVEAGFGLSESRAVSGGVSAAWGGYYDGDAFSYSAELQWRPTTRFRLGFAYEEDRLRMPAGDLVVRVKQLNFDLGFSPHLTWQNIVQADNESDSLGLQSRLHWLIEDGREVFLVVQTGWERLPDGTIAPEERQLALKLVWAVRF